MASRKQAGCKQDGACLRPGGEAGGPEACSAAAVAGARCCALSPGRWCWALSTPVQPVLVFHCCEKVPRVHCPQTAFIILQFCGLDQHASQWANSQGVRRAASFLASSRGRSVSFTLPCSKDVGQWAPTSSYKTTKFWESDGRHSGYS